MSRKRSPEGEETYPRKRQKGIESTANIPTSDNTDKEVVSLEDGRDVHLAELFIPASTPPPAYSSNNEDDAKEDPRRDRMRVLCDKAFEWIGDASLIRVTDVELRKLEEREQNVPRDRARAQLEMENIENLIKAGEHDIHCFSTKVVDKEGNLLCAYFSNRLKDGSAMTFRSEEQYNIFMKEMQDTCPDKIVRDGLDRLSLDYIAFGTQVYLGIAGVEPGKQDLRHDKRGNNEKRFPPKHYSIENKFLFESRVPPRVTTPIPRFGRHQHLANLQLQSHRYDPPNTSPDAEKVWYYEERGVRHLDRLWSEQGRHHSKNAVLSMSRDLNSGASYIVNAGHAFMQNIDRYTQELLLPHVVAACPAAYEETYRRTYCVAAVDRDEQSSPGFHIGHVIVHKQPIHQHMDGGDSGFCVTFCTGSFSGGYLILADLGLAFLYRPGDVMIFRSKALYHGVTTWLPEGDVSPLGITPGRTAHVFYTQQATVNFAKRKGIFPGWSRLTSLGKVAATRKEDLEPVKDVFPVSTDPIFSKLRKRAYHHQRDTRSGACIKLPPHMKMYSCDVDQ